jgi:methyl-accepting chemotaxis protein
MTRQMEKLAAGQLDVAVKDIERQDEIGAMARAFAIFRENAVERVALASAQAEESASRAKRIQRIDEMVRHFEVTVAKVLSTLSASTGSLQETARVMADTTSNAASTVGSSAAATARASESVKSVFEASGRMSVAINSISAELSKSTTMSHSAVESVEASASQMRALADSIHQIREIVDMINGIAGQTNLLALNATIEAARAGSAGKGFAVVATEVKALATQTAKATKDITDKIGNIQSGTDQTVEAVQKVRDIIENMDHALTTIAAAVKEQDSATREISASSQQAATDTDQVAEGIQVVAKDVQKVDSYGSALKQVVIDLSQQAATLRTEVELFIHGIRES